MNPFDLTLSQLKRAAAIKERVEGLNRELRSLLGGSTNSGRASIKKTAMSASVKKKIAAAQKARWAKLRRVKSATRSATPASKAKKKTMSPAARARMSAKLKAYWAKKKAGKK
jgi:hypothetical protein